MGREVAVMSAAEATQERRTRFDMEDLKYIERMHEALQVLSLIRNGTARVYGPIEGTPRGVRMLSFIVVYDDSAILKIANYARRTFEVVVGNSSSRLRDYLYGPEHDVVYQLPRSPVGFVVRVEDADEYNALYAARKQAADVIQAYMRAAAMLACSTAKAAARSNNDVVRRIAMDVNYYAYRFFILDLWHVAELLDVEHGVARDYSMLLKKLTECESYVGDEA